MFDDFDLGDGYYGAGPSSVSYQGPETGYDTSGVGDWGSPELMSGFAALEQGGGDSPLAQFYQDPTSYATPSSDWARGAPSAENYGSNAESDSAKLDARMKALDSQSPQSSPLAKMFGMKTDSEGNMDWTDGKNLTKMLQALGAGGNFLSKLLAKGKQANYQSPQQLMAQMPKSAYDSWSPTQQQWANQFFNTPYTPAAERQKIYASEMRNPIVPGRGYAEGGDVEGMGEEQGPLTSGYIDADTGGQDDVVMGSLNGKPNAIAMAGGEYVFDADVVAALGDGNNAAGAKKLDELREAIRQRSRSAPVDKIPPLSMGVDEMAGMLGGEEKE